MVYQGVVVLSNRRLQKGDIVPGSGYFLVFFPVKDLHQSQAELHILQRLLNVSDVIKRRGVSIASICCFDVLDSEQILTHGQHLIAQVVRVLVLTLAEIYQG